jgi:hypothetical protein
MFAAFRSVVAVVVVIVVLGLWTLLDIVQRRKGTDRDNFE